MFINITIGVAQIIGVVLVLYYTFGLTRIILKKRANSKNNNNLSIKIADVVNVAANEPLSLFLIVGFLLILAGPIYYYLTGKGSGSGKKYKISGHVRVFDIKGQPVNNFNCKSIQIYKFFPPDIEVKADGYFPDNLDVQKIYSDFPMLTITSTDENIIMQTVDLQHSIAKSIEMDKMSGLSTDEKIQMMEKEHLYYTVIDGENIMIKSPIKMMYIRE